MATSPNSREKNLAEKFLRESRLGAGLILWEFYQMPQKSLSNACRDRSPMRSEGAWRGAQADAKSCAISLT